MYWVVHVRVSHICTHSLLGMRHSESRVEKSEVLKWVAGWRGSEVVVKMYFGQRRHYALKHLTVLVFSPLSHQYVRWNYRMTNAYTRRETEN